MKLIDKIIAAKEEVLKRAKAPIMRNRVERAISSAIDNSEDRIMDMEGKIQDLYSVPEELPSNLDKVVDYRNKIAAEKRLIEILKSEKSLLFEQEVK